MKKIYLLSLALLCGLFAYANQVSVDSAKIAGTNFLSQHGITTTGLELTYTSSNAGVNCFYVFSTAHSFVIVAADDAVKPVIGYSDEGAFKTNMPSQVASWLNGYEKQIIYAISSNASAAEAVTSQWNDLKANTARRTARTTTVSPLLATTWDQSPDYLNPTGYYNDNCPYDAGAGANCVTGCVATATAQVMKFWNWPATGAGSVSYYTSAYGTLSADLGASTYDWASMPASLTAHNPALAKLMSDVGISVNMNYTPDESSAYVISSGSGTPPYCAEYSLKTYFNYDASLHGEARASYDDATWISMLETNLTAGEPVIYAGFGSSGGHCFVFDGFDGSDNMHVNWGWSGLDDGYYAIDALDPPSLGTGGGSGGFNSGQQAIFGIKPADTSTVISTGSGLVLYDYVNLSAATIGYGSAFTVSTNIYNTGVTDFSGDFCAAAFDASGTFVTYIDSVMSTSLPTGDIFTSDLSFPTAGLYSLLPGMYTVGIFYRPTGGGWTAVSNYSSFSNFPTLTVVNPAPLELYAAMLPSPTTFVQGSAASVNLNIYNTGTMAFGSGTADFSGNYDVSLYNLDGTLACEIQNMSSMSLPAGEDYLSPYLTFSTTNVTAAPGTYLLALSYADGTVASPSYYLAGSDYFQNPIYINVVAPPLSPDPYEPDNTAATAYTLPLSFTGDVAAASTTGSNFHIVTDQDYYKIVLPAGYTYSVTARVNDNVGTDDGLTYTTDAIWSYSADGGSTWSSDYEGVMPGIITVPATGGSIIFHCSPAYGGDMGTYLLKISNVTRAAPIAVAQVNMEAVKIFPVPAADMINIDMTGTNAHAVSATLTDMTGRKVYEAAIANQTIIQMPVSNLASGVYFVNLITEEGTLQRKVTVAR